MTTASIPMFNPFAFAKRLKDVGVPDQQADTEAEVLHEALVQQAQAVSAQVMSAVESKFTALEERTKRDVEQMATKADIALVRKEIAIARRDTIIWLGGMLIAGFGSVITLLLRFSG